MCVCCVRFGRNSRKHIASFNKYHHLTAISNKSTNPVVFVGMYRKVCVIQLLLFLLSSCSYCCFVWYILHTDTHSYFHSPSSTKHLMIATPIFFKNIQRKWERSGGGEEIDIKYRIHLPTSSHNLFNTLTKPYNRILSLQKKNTCLHLHFSACFLLTSSSSF